MDIQTEVQKIHHQYGISEKANYEIQKLFDKAIKEAVTEALRKTDVRGSLLKSLHQDLKGFQEMAFLTPDVKTGLGIAIEQVERHMRNELEARQH